MSRPGGTMGLTHIFSELTSQDELNVPLGRSARLRYTCLSVCKKYIALGSNSGGTYIFSRDTLKYLQVVFSDTNAVPVDLVSLSPSDHLIGLGLSNGQVTIFELNIEKRSKPERVRQTLDHSGHGVTVMTWDSTSTRLYVGDDSGKISVISVPSSKTKTLFSTPSQVIALLESSVYQIQWWKEKLLVSTVTHSHLFDTTKHTYSTIGTKPRAGEFGSCFFLEPNSQVPVIYCARPGSRMWEVSFEGKVLNTHQFKQLMAVPPVPVVRSRSEAFDFTNEIPYQGLSTNFLKMFSMGHFIITWSSKGLYMFDPINVKLVMWTQSIKSIKDVCVYRNDIYLFLENTTVQRLTVLPIYQLFTVLASRQRWTLLAQMLLAADVINFRPAALKRVKRDLLLDIYQGLKQSGKEQLLERVRASMEDVSEGSVDSLGPDATEDFLDSLELKGYIFLSSGMVVRDGLGVDGTNKDGPSFERYIPSQEHMRRSASDESFYNEETEEYKREVLENEISPSSRENLAGDEIVNSPQEDSDPSTGKQDQIGNNYLSKPREDLSQDDTQISPPVVKAKADEKIGRAEKIPTTEFKPREDDLVAEYSATEDKNEFCPSQSLTVCESAGLGPPEYLNSLDSPAKSAQHMIKENSTLDVDGFVCESESNIPDSMINTIKNQQNKNLTPQDNLLNNDAASMNGTLSHTSSPTQSSNSSETLQASHKSKSQTAGEINNSSISNHLNELDQIEHERKQPLSVQEQVSDSKAEDYEIVNVQANADPSAAPYAPSAYEQAHQILSSFQLPHKNSQPLDSKQAVNKDESSLPSDKSPSEAPSAVHINTDKISDVEGQIAKDESNLPSDRSPSEAPSAAGINTEKILDVEGQTDSVNSQPVLIETSKDQNPGRESSLDSRSNKTLSRFASVPAPTGNDDIIARPHRHSKKKSKSKRLSQDAFRGKISRSASVGTESEAFTRRVPELDSLSVSTISSVEEEEEELSSKSYPDLRASDGCCINEVLDVKKTHDSASFLEDRRHSETIPPLVDRLAAARSLEDSGEFLGGSSLNSSGEHGLTNTSALGPLSVLKDGLSLKLKNQTKSLIKSLKETNILTKSASASRLDRLSDQQRSQRDLSISPPPYGERTVSAPLSPSSVGREDEEQFEEMFALDTAPLYTIALEIKRELLSSPNALLDPRQLQTLLGRWAREIILAVGKVSVELRARKNLAEPTAETAVKSQRSASPIEPYISPRKQKFQTSPHNIRSHGLEASPAMGDPASRSLPNSLDTRSPPSQTCSPSSGVSMEHDSPTKHSSDFTDPAGFNWASVLHANSPFEIPPKHLELFQWLTTCCWACGVNTDVVSILNGLGANQSIGTPDAINPHGKSTSEAGEESCDVSGQRASQDACLRRESSETIGSEENYLLLIRNIVPPTLFESVMEQRCELAVPSFLSLLSDSLTSSSHSNNSKKDNYLLRNPGIERLSHSTESFSYDTLNSPSNTQNCKSLGKGKCSPFVETDSDINDNTCSRSLKYEMQKKEELTPVYTEMGNRKLVGSGSCSDSDSLSAKCDSNDENDIPYNKKFVGLRGNTSSSVDNSIIASHSASSSSPNGNQLTSWGHTAELREDINLALFTRLLFFLLDFDQVRRTWEEHRSREKPLFLTWVSLVTCSEEKGLGDIVSSILADKQTKSAVDYLRSGILPHKSAMIGHLLELFRQAPLMASDFCGELSKAVTPLDLVGMCALTGRPALVHLLRYFKQAMLDTAAFFRPVRFGHLVEQPEIRYLLLQSQLPALSKVHNESSSSGVSPALVAELLNVLPPNWMEIILEKIQSDEERESIIWLCSQFQYHQLCVRLLAQAGQCHRLLRWIVELDDIRLLQSQHCYPEAYLPRDITEWTFLLTCMRKNCCSRVSSRQLGTPKVIEETHNEQVNAGGQVPDTDQRERTKEEASPSKTLSHGNEGGSVTLAPQGNIHEETEETLFEDPSLVETNSEDAGLKNTVLNRNQITEQREVLKSTEEKDELGEKGQDVTRKGEISTRGSASINEKLRLKSFTNNAADMKGDKQEALNPWSLTWGSVGYLLLEHLGGAAAINLLVSHMTEEGDDPGRAWSGLGSEFVQACYASFLVEGQKDQVSHEMLERMSVFMWAKKPGFLSPSVHHAFKAEQSLAEKKQGRETDVQRVFGQVKSLSNQSLKSEYLGGHWGVSTDLSRRCGVCNLPLKTIVSLAVQGAIVFPCGHAYHRCCMSGSACPQLH